MVYDITLCISRCMDDKQYLHNVYLKNPDDVYDWDSDTLNSKNKNQKN